MEGYYRVRNQMPPEVESRIVDYEPLTKQEISHQPNWFDLPKGDSGDPDLADY